MTRPAQLVSAVAVLALVSCVSSGGPSVTPDTLYAASLLGEVYCSEPLGEGSVAVWRCKVYLLGDRVLVGFHDVLSGRLRAIGEQVNGGPQVIIRWRVEPTPVQEQAEGRTL